jgi:hypothetical protein
MHLDTAFRSMTTTEPPHLSKNQIETIQNTLQDQNQNATNSTKKTWNLNHTQILKGYKDNDSIPQQALILQEDYNYEQTIRKKMKLTSLY